jgi:transposase-like protein
LIAAESLMPGMQVTEVARKHDVTRWQAYDWRRRFWRGPLALPESLATTFAPLMVDPTLRKAHYTQAVRIPGLAGFSVGASIPNVRLTQMAP